MRVGVMSRAEVSGAEKRVGLSEIRPSTGCARLWAICHWLSSKLPRTSRRLAISIGEYLKLFRKACSRAAEAACRPPATIRRAGGHDVAPRF